MAQKIKDQDEKIIKITQMSSDKEQKLIKEIQEYKKKLSKLQSTLELSEQTIS